MADTPKSTKAVDPPPLEIRIGDVVLDRYRVAEQIASGGHSVVFLGQDERLNRPVCIKVFSGFGGKSGVGRTSYEHFVQEAFALSRLTHPNTLRIYDFGHLGSKDAEGMPIQVCEYMNGGTLSNIVREQGRQSVEETVRVIGAMCAALAEAHGLGIVHRDIKPQNILFGSVGTDKLPKLADFGIAKWTVDDEKEKQERNQRAEDTAIVAGQKLAMYSPSWAAPEQLAGQPVSAATDIYSLAVVAIYMLTGRAIFADEDVYAGYKKRRNADEIVRDALRSTEAGPATAELLIKALSFDPTKRLTKVDLFHVALKDLLDPDELPTPIPLTQPGKLSARDLRIELKTPSDPFETLTPTAKVQRAEPDGSVESIGPSTHVPGSRTGPPTGPGARTLEPARMPTPRGSDRVSVQQVAPQPHEYPRQQLAPVPQIQLQPPAESQWNQTPAVPRPPWMQVPAPLTGQTRPLLLTDVPQPAGDRTAHFVQATHGGHVDIVGPQATKVRITLLNAPTGLVIHVKGLTCFVAKLGGRPSPAVQMEGPGDLALVTPRAQEIGHIRVTVGEPEGTMRRFAVGTERVGVRADDCMDPILFDFGPGSDAYFVYTRGRAVPRSRTR
ncbi:MAG TPA: protein kinase [Kofleriaceae bacterium]|jgi:serine/threonine-protein kinase